jgi:hypothetical protein
MRSVPVSGSPTRRASSIRSSALDQQAARATSCAPGGRQEAAAIALEQLHAQRITADNVDPGAAKKLVDELGPKIKDGKEALDGE